MCFGFDGGHDVQRDVDALKVGVDELRLELDAQQREVVAVLHVADLVLLLQDALLQLLLLLNLLAVETS